MNDNSGPAASKPPPAKLFTRRRVLKMAGGLAGSAVAIGLYTWRIEPHWLQVVERDLPIAGLPDALVGRRLIQVSDLHVGPVVDRDYLAAALTTVNSLRPDLLVLTGDFMTAFENEQVDNVGLL